MSFVDRSVKLLADMPGREMHGDYLLSVLRREGLELPDDVLGGLRGDPRLEVFEREDVHSVASTFITLSASGTKFAPGVQHSGTATVRNQGGSRLEIEFGAWNAFQPLVSLSVERCGPGAVLYTIDDASNLRTAKVPLHFGMPTNLISLNILGEQQHLGVNDGDELEVIMAPPHMLVRRLPPHDDSSSKNGPRAR